MFVLTKIFETATASSMEPIASCDPPLNPNQPNQSINVPNVARGMLDAGIGVDVPSAANLQILGPMIIAPAKAAAPPAA